MFLLELATCFDLEYVASYCKNIDFIIKNLCLSYNN